MRRFSQRSHLVTLSELNITPLLDLAFVLLIIFVITTPLLEQGREVALPEGGAPDKELRKEDFLTVEVDGKGYWVGRENLSLAGVRDRIVRQKQSNPRTVVFIRADRATPFDQVFQLADFCGQQQIAVSFRSKPPGEMGGRR